MAKYSEEQLTAMAKSAIYHRTADPKAYLVFVTTLKQRTGLTEGEIERRIYLMANGHFNFKEYTA